MTTTTTTASFADLIEANGEPSFGHHGRWSWIVGRDLITAEREDVGRWTVTKRPGPTEQPDY